MFLVDEIINIIVWIFSIIEYNMLFFRYVFVLNILCDLWCFLWKEFSYNVFLIGGCFYYIVFVFYIKGNEGIEYFYIVICDVIFIIKNCNNIINFLFFIF